MKIVNVMTTESVDNIHTIYKWENTDFNSPIGKPQIVREKSYNEEEKKSPKGC